MTRPRSRIRRLFVLGPALIWLCVPMPIRAQLTLLGHQSLEQGQGGLEGDRATDDAFGGKLAVGDFDGDGFDDLAVGIPFEDISGLDSAGAVQIIYGSAAGLTGARDVIFSQSTTGVPETSEANDAFGFALAAMDFDCDGFDDLAVGAPFENLGAIPFPGNEGAVWIFSGSASGLSTSSVAYFDEADWPQDSREGNDQLGLALVGVSNGSTSNPVRKLYIGAPGEGITFGSLGGQGAAFGLLNFCDGDGFTPADRLSQDGTGFADSCEDGDHFGESLGKGDFNGDGVDDLVIGVPSENHSAEDEGAVHVVYGTADGSWRGSNSEFWHQNVAGILDQVENHDNFGQALSSGDFDNDGFDDLAVGIAESAGTIALSGAVSAIYGSASRLTDAGDQLWSQAGEIAGGEEQDDAFGQSVAVGDFDGDGAADLASGVPFEDIGDLGSAGAVNVIYGRSFFGLDTPGNQFFDQDTPGLDTAVAETGDHFGRAVAAGDFNGDGRDDLAIGVPEEDAASIANAGLVHILYGADNDILGNVHFTISSVLVMTEQTIVLVLNVERVGPTNLAVSVGHHLVAGSTTAGLGVDFEYTSGNLNWGVGEAGVKPIFVRVLGDTLPEPAEFVRVELLIPSTGTSIVSPASRTIQITDNDSADPSIFLDGFETGNTSRWSAVVP